MNRRVERGVLALACAAMAGLHGSPARARGRRPDAPTRAAPPTLLTRPGALLLDERFTGPLPAARGDLSHFAGGYQGWRLNLEPRAGRWEVRDGLLTGTEDAAHRHPATASYGLRHRDLVLSFEVRLDGVPWEGRGYRYFHLRTTHARGYHASLSIGPDGVRLGKEDLDREGPDRAAQLARIDHPIELDRWIPVVFEQLGDELVATVDGRTLAGKAPGLAIEKHSFMFVAGTQVSVRGLRVFAARPNPAWPRLRRGLPAPDPDSELLLLPEALAGAAGVPEEATGAPVTPPREQIEELGVEGVRQRRVRGVTRAELTAYPVRAGAVPPRPGVVIVPGGGAAGLEIDLQGHVVARWLSKAGVAAFVLKYRSGAWDAAVQDVALALGRVRAEGARFGGAAAAAGLLAFADGCAPALAAALAAPRTAQPDFLALVQPAASCAQAGALRGPVLLVEAESDGLAATSTGAAALWRALRGSGVAVELLQVRGELALRGLHPSVREPPFWSDVLLRWLACARP